MFAKNESCTVNGNSRKHKIEDNRCCMYLVNEERKEYHHIIIDGCDKVNGRKCDFGLYLLDACESLLIELKGSDINHAVRQIEETIKYYGFKRGQKLKCFVISSHNPLSATVLQNKKTSFLRSHGFPLIIQKSGHEYHYPNS
jgi:hypothetical protein